MEAENHNELAKGIYWVGAIDWDVRNFHGYSTRLGSTYNAYLIIDEKITLIDTVKAPFADSLIAEISKYTDVSKIDLIISNHAEPDHSGSLPVIKKLCPNAPVLCTAQGAGILRSYYGDLGYKTVKTGDDISIGAHTLKFVSAPMVHWPDNMVTYCPENKILFSNDAFGQHYATSGRFDDRVDINETYTQAAKYYANIVFPYGAQAAKELSAAESLEIETIAPSHGVIWRKYIPEIVEKYKMWSRNGTIEKAIVVYDSMWGSTRKMAYAIAEAFAEKGIAVLQFNLSVTDSSDIMKEMLEAHYLCVGSPTLNTGVMPSVASFLTYMSGLAPKGRAGFAFGSYGWGGQSVKVTEDALADAGFYLFLPAERWQYAPTDDYLNELKYKVINAI